MWKISIDPRIKFKGKKANRLQEDTDVFTIEAGRKKYGTKKETAGTRMY